MVTGCPTCFFDGFCAHKYWESRASDTGDQKLGRGSMKSPASSFLDIDELFLAPQSSWVGTESKIQLPAQTLCEPSHKVFLHKTARTGGKHQFSTFAFSYVNTSALPYLCVCLSKYILYNVLGFFWEPETYSKIGFLQLLARFWFLAAFDWLQPYSNVDFFQLLAKIILVGGCLVYCKFNLKKLIPKLFFQLGWWHVHRACPPWWTWTNHEITPWTPLS